MKHTNVLTKLAGMKAKVVGVVAATALAAAIFTVATPQAQAERFAVGVRIGGPVFVGRPVYGPVYGPPVYPYGYYHHDDWRFRHEYRHGWR